MDTTLIIGTSGSLLVLIAFVLNKLNIWQKNLPYYNYTNFLGSFLLIIYALLLKSYPFIILNTIWAVVSLKDIVANVFDKKTTK